MAISVSSADATDCFVDYIKRLSQDKLGAVFFIFIVKIPIAEFYFFTNFALLRVGFCTAVLRTLFLMLSLE